MKIRHFILGTTFFLIMSSGSFGNSAVAQENTPGIKSVAHPIIDKIRAYFSDTIISAPSSRRKGQLFKRILKADGTWETDRSSEGNKWWVIRTEKLCLKYGPYSSRRSGRMFEGGQTRCWKVRIINDNEFELTSPRGRTRTWKRQKK